MRIIENIQEFWNSLGRDRDSTQAVFPDILDAADNKSSSHQAAIERMASTYQFKHHLVLHFDINETILVGDEAGGDTRHDTVNKMLAKSAFVLKPKHFQDSSDTHSMEPTHWCNALPIREKYDDISEADIPPLYVGWEWPTDCVPYYRTKLKKNAKTFTEHHGSFYRPLYERLQKRLQPKDPRAAKEYPILSHVLPAFFVTLQALCQRTQTFTICLRTMGTDLPEIAEAITAFAQGKHPDYRDFVDERLVLTPDKLVQGRWSRETDKNGNHQYELWQEDSIVASGDAEVLKFLHSHTICGIQDDYEFWNQNHCQPWAGKPVWILPDKTYQHILLDDNIHNLPEDSIAGGRQLLANGSFRTLSGEEVQRQQGRHFIRVPTIAPILDSNWFLRKIDCAQARFITGDVDVGVSVLRPFGTDIV